MKPGQIIKKFVSKKGNEVILRNIANNDAVGMMRMINSVIAEDDFILATKKLTLNKEKEFVINCVDKINKKEKIFIVVEQNGKIIGNSSIDKGHGVRSHVGSFGIVLMNGYREEGIGKVLMKEIISLASKLFKIKIITLEVYQTNKRAHGLYKKMGFKYVGTMPKSIIRRGKYIPEIIMYKEL